MGVSVGLGKGYIGSVASIGLLGLRGEQADSRIITVTNKRAALFCISRSFKTFFVIFVSRYKFRALKTVTNHLW